MTICQRSFYRHLAGSAVAVSTFSSVLPFFVVSSYSPFFDSDSRTSALLTPRRRCGAAFSNDPLSLRRRNNLRAFSSRGGSIHTTRKNLDEQELTKDAMQIIRDAIRAVDPCTAIRSNLVRDGNILIFPKEDFQVDLSRDYDKIILVGFGKASTAMATTVLEQIFPSDCAGEKETQSEGATIDCQGVIICKDGHATESETQVLEQHKVKIFEASHPVPDGRSSLSAGNLLEIVKKEASPRTLVLCCISGGGSALFCKPAPPLTLQDLQEMNAVLLGSGMGIEEMNVVRKRLEEGKGGRLAEACFPSHVVSLILSDVIGDPLDLIASGPTVPDRSTWQDGWEIVQTYNLEDRLPEKVVEILRDGMNGQLEDSPSPDHPVFETARNILVGNNALAVEAASETAETLGYQPVVLGTEIQGEAKEVAKFYISMASHLQKTLSSNEKHISSSGRMDRFASAQRLPVALIAGGETTVSLTPNSGKGGRNQELALSAAVQLDTLDLRNVVLTSVGTDGGDGPTDAAGAVVDATTIRANRSRALEALAKHDAYPYLDGLNEALSQDDSKEFPPLIKTGPSGTNVADICVTLIRPAP